MNCEQALEIANQVVFNNTGTYLTDCQKFIFKNAFEGKTYDEMGNIENEKYSASHLGNVGQELWQLLSDALGEKVSKTNFKAALERQSQVRVPSNSVGSTIYGRYKIIQKLGGGDFNETYLAEKMAKKDEDFHGNHLYVVKQLRSPYDETGRRLLKREATVLLDLSKHDQIPQLFDYFHEEQQFYLVQEYIEGQELSEELLPGCPRSEAQVIALLRDLLEILKFVHQQGVIHRNIHPKNLIRRQKDGKIVLIDFGGVKQINTQLVNSQEPTSSTIPIGTNGYMPSEQADGVPQLCSDIYAVGIIGIQALTGLHPLELRRDRQTRELVWRNKAKVSPELANILDKMVRRNFEERYPSAVEAWQAIQSLRTSE